DNLPVRASPRAAAERPAPPAADPKHPRKPRHDNRTACEDRGPLQSQSPNCISDVVAHRGQLSAVSYLRADGLAPCYSGASAGKRLQCARGGGMRIAAVVGLVVMLAGGIGAQSGSPSAAPAPKQFASGADVTAMIARAKRERKPDQANFVQPI